MSDDNSDAATVFVIDDDPAVRDSFSTLLNAYGMAVEVYDSVLAFQRAYRARRGACLILDQHMPGTTGLEFLGSAEGKRLTMPVILVTAHNDKDTRTQATEAGVFAFLSKPVDSGLLMDAVADAIGRRGPIHPLTGGR